MWPARWDGPAWVQRLQRIAAAIAQRPTLDDTDRWALERVERQGTWLAHGDCSHSRQTQSPAQVVHGDFQPSNWFVSGGELSAVIDWDNAACMPRAFELVRACFFGCEMKPALVAALVSGYREVARLTAAELAEGAALWGIFADHHVWALEETYLHGNRRATRYIWQRPFRPFADEWRDCGVE